jgi:rare lipoprotein A
MKLIQACSIITLMILVQACSTPSRYQQSQDSTPIFQQSIANLAEPQPIREPMSRRGNPDRYEVWGKTYEVDKGLTEYSQQGTASWYGKKFHGHDTSNGERFDVYQFSAAHKSLPLPSYVRVTNLDNNKSLVVRVNDRGPFHGDRLIDLSYAAAVRLDFAKKGTANVKVDLLAAPLSESDYLFLQVAAFEAEPSALIMQQRLTTVVEEPVYITKDATNGKMLHKVRIGPLSPSEVEVVQSTLRAQDIHSTLIGP